MDDKRTLLLLAFCRTRTGTCGNKGANYVTFHYRETYLTIAPTELADKANKSRRRLI